MVSVLKYPVLNGQTLTSQITFGLTAPSLNTPTLQGAGLPTGQTLTINTSPLSITDKTSTPAPITLTGVRASNGVIHGISKDLIRNSKPPEASASNASPGLP